MRRFEIIKELKVFFDVVELVCPHTYNAWGESSWQFLDIEYLHDLLVVRRDILKSPMYANNWDKNGNLSQRGNRCNICQIVKDNTKKNKVYLSAHINGKAGDFDVKGMTAEDARKKIIDNKDMMPYPFRLEGGVSWLHMDCFDTKEGTMLVVF